MTVTDFDFRLSPPLEQATRALRMAETTSRPLGGASWISELEARTGRELAAKRSGRKGAGIRLLSP